MTLSGRIEVVVGIDNIMFGHGRHMFHVVSNPSLIFNKRRSGLGLNLGYGFEDLFMSAVIQIDFMICCSLFEHQPGAATLSESIGQPGRSKLHKVTPAGLRPLNRTTLTYVGPADIVRYSWARSNMTRDQWQ